MSRPPADGDGAPIEGIALGPDVEVPEPAETITEEPQAPFMRVKMSPPRKWRRVGSWNELLECPADGTLVSGQRGAHLHLRHFHSDNRTGELVEWAEDLWDEIEDLHKLVADHARRNPRSDRRRMWGPEWWRRRGHNRHE